MMKSTYFFTFTINNINRIVIPPKEKGFKKYFNEDKKNYNTWVKNCW